MGKKQNQHQRTKGNLQASSSSRAAQLLQNKNANISPAVGFTKDNDSGETSVDSILSTSFRKLGKKESVTKQKALSEILEAVSEENIGGCLILWARFFSRISIDNERKIRELSQEVHSKIVTLAGRNLAPYLNNVMGPWLEGSCDMHFPTSQIAATSLDTAFSGDKLPNAITFCEKGLTKHLRDRLGSTPNTLSDMKITDPVDAEEKYSRVIGSTLRMFVFLLSTADNLESIHALLQDNLIWALGRSKILQVRKHVYSFISGVSKLPSYIELPEVAYKIVTLQLNTCKHETAGQQYDALESVLVSCPDRFWSVVSVSDVRGQILDAIKSKALIGGVLQSVLSHMPSIVTVFYRYCIERGTSNVWYEDVLSNSSKCLSQCKLHQDKLAIVNFIEKVAQSIKSTYGQSVPDVALKTVCLMITTLTSSTISSDLAEPLESFLKNLSYNVITDSDGTPTGNPTSLFLLQSVKKSNEAEVTNTLAISKILLNIRPEGKDIILRQISFRCEQQIAGGEFEYVSRVLEDIVGLSAVLFVKLTHGDSSDLSLINLANSTFIPHFSNTSYTTKQINQLSKVVIMLLPHSNSPYQNIVQTLVTLSCHRNTAFLAFLKEQVLYPSKQFLSGIFMCETFDSLSDKSSQELEDTVSSLVELCSSITDLSQHFVNFIQSSLTASPPSLGDKFFTLLKYAKWTPRYTESIKLIIESTVSSEDLVSFTPALTNIVATNPRFSADIIEKVINIDKITVLDIEEFFKKVFSPNIALVLEYCSKHLPIPAVDTSILMDLFDQFGVLSISEFCYGATWSDIDMLLLKATIKFLNQFSFSEDISEYVCLHLSRLIVLDFLVNKTDHPRLVDRVRQHAPGALHIILSEVIKNHGMLVIYLLNDLIIHNYEISWDKIDGISSLSLESLVILSENFHLNITDFIQAKESDTTNNLCYMAHVARQSDSATLSKIIDTLSETYLGDIDNLCVKDLPLICKSFSNIFHCNSATDESIEFVLCSTATIIQATLEIITEEFDLEQQFFFSATLLSFDRLYNALQSAIHTDDYFSRFLEDWELFFEPGIQDLVLVLHDRILSSSLKKTASYLSPVVLLAPSNSVKSFMKQVFKSSQEITFNQCFDYIMGFYEKSELKTQIALFFLLLQCQKIFNLETEEINEIEETEDAQFDSPPKIYLDCLSKIDLVNFESTAEYENRLLKATHVWILLLITESEVDADVLREHVEFLRSKHILSDFLDNLVYLIRFSSRKYDIIHLENVLESSSFESHQLASTCFMGVASIFPALLRSWWKRLGKEMTISVETFVKSFISPSLIKVETNFQTNPEDETLVIKARPVVREVIATYTMDDITADLIINIANNHPLTPPTVSCERQIGVPLSVWRSWMLQMTSMFQNQNSSIVHALEHWRNNMDKQFEGLESCMICFSMVQGKKKALPKPKCKTCKKSFHSACLYKWFSTSGKSTCPMCRSVFQHSTGLRARLQEEPGPV